MIKNELKEVKFFDNNNNDLNATQMAVPPEMLNYDYDGGYHLSDKHKKQLLKFAELDPPYLQ